MKWRQILLRSVCLIWFFFNFFFKVCNLVKALLARPIANFNWNSESVSYENKCCHLWQRFLVKWFAHCLLRKYWETHSLYNTNSFCHLQYYCFANSPVKHWFEHHPSVHLFICSSVYLSVRPSMSCLTPHAYSICFKHHGCRTICQSNAVQSEQVWLCMPFAKQAVRLGPFIFQHPCTIYRAL